MVTGEIRPQGEYVLLRHNRRSDLRHLIIVLKVNEASTDTLFGYAKCLSKCGMFIASVSPRPVGEEVDISFTNPADDTESVCKCRVIWRREYGDEGGEPGMGIRFLNLDYEVSKRLDDWIKQELKKGPHDPA